MPVRVIVDDEVAEAVKAHAEPLIDSFNSALRRVLGLSPGPQSHLFFEIERVETSLPRSAHGAKPADRKETQVTESAGRRHPQGRRRALSVTSKKRSRAPKGSLLDERAYWTPILRVLADSPSGASPARDVVERVGQILDDQLTPLDREEVGSGGLRWHTRTMFARLRMKDAGLLKKDSPRGVWEISDLGRQALVEGRFEGSSAAA